MARHISVLLLLLPTCISAYVVVNRQKSFLAQNSRTKLGATQSAVPATQKEACVVAIDACIQEGRDPKAAIAELEALYDSDNPSMAAPNRSPGYFGTWHTWYTDCPPPSNGQLGPFKGTSGQVIDDDLTRRSYQNLLKVPPNDWLTATLDGIWEEWDGVHLDEEDTDEAGTPDKTRDWGADHWKVTFMKLHFGLFGRNIWSFDFPPSTSRIWRTTFMDDDIRIVRAGRSGRPEDEFVFYTKREVAPTQ